MRPAHGASVQLRVVRQRGNGGSFQGRYRHDPYVACGVQETCRAELILTRGIPSKGYPLNQQEKISMRNKELIVLLQEQDPEAEVMIRTSDDQYYYDLVEVFTDKDGDVIIQEG